MIYKLKSIFRHAWLDASDTKRALPPAALERLAQRVACSETRHSGQIRICAEASLPLSYLWRLGPTTGMADLARQRAVMMFSKLRVWDTVANNGVLIYLLLAEHSIEIVVDRGLAHVPAAQWQAMVDSMSATFKAGRFEDGLSQAVDEVSALLMKDFPAQAVAGRVNELPDEPVIG